MSEVAAATITSSTWIMVDAAPGTPAHAHPQPMLAAIDGARHRDAPACEYKCE